MQKNETFFAHGSSASIVKQIIGMLAAILLLLPAIAAYDETAIGQIDSKFADIYVVASNFDPSPLMPGGYAEVWLKVENRGDRDAPDVHISIPDTYPFRIAPGEERTKSVGRLVARDSAIVYFKLLLDAGAPSGITALKVEVRETQDSFPITRQVNVQIARIDAVLSIDDVVSTPTTVAPGETVEIKIVISNKADTSLRAIEASLVLLTQVTTTTGLSTVELPFTPIRGGIQETVDLLSPGESDTLTFSLIADPDAESKPYKIPVQITYYDPNGQNRTRTEVVGVIIGSEPELTIYIDETEISSKRTAGTVLVRFVNRGTSDIKFLNARLDQTEEFIIVNSAEQYIGKIDSDDFEIAEFNLALTKNAGNEVQLPIVVFYRDANNKEYSKGVSLTLVRHTPEQLGQKQNNTLLIIAVIIVVLWLGWYYFRRRNRNKRK